MTDLVLAIDQGTSSTKCVLADGDGTVVRTVSVPVPIRYPRPGWVEQDAGEILDSVLVAAAKCLDGVPVKAVGLSTQRESALVWDRRTGEPLGPVLGWQDRRAASICRDISDPSLVRAISGLPLDPMFSAAKFRWLLDEHPDALVGTVDSWLLYALTGSHQIEVGNASRTQLLDVRAGSWSPELLDVFGIPASALPVITPSSGDLGSIGRRGGVLAGLPITAVLGDSHAALYAHGDSGGVKVTYGTGSSVMRLLPTSSGTGSGAPDRGTGPGAAGSGAAGSDAAGSGATGSGAAGGLGLGSVCLTVAWDDRLAAEGNIRSSGSTVAWLAGLLRVTPEEIGRMAADATSDGVQIVPAFGGLAAPWWDEDATGLISGLSLASGPEQLARAAVESIAHQVTDVIEAMGGSEAMGGGDRILADGGASSNDHLMRVQADLCGIAVRRARTGNLSALGVAFLAGGSRGWSLEYDDFEPRPCDPSLRSSWRAAVARTVHKEPS